MGCVVRTDAFEVVSNLLPADAIHEMADFIAANQQRSLGEQSGFNLSLIPEIGRWLMPLEEFVSDRLGTRVPLRLDRSSCRTQVPNGIGKFALHQDVAAFADTRRTLLPPFAKPANTVHRPHCVIWLPLCAIDDETPTLQACPRLPQTILAHEADKAGYSILIDQNEETISRWAQAPLVINRMNPGDGVLMSGLTVHGTFVSPSHTKTRRSLDLRFLAPESPKPWRGLIDEASFALEHIALGAAKRLRRR
jgi:hypothetical protein